MKDEMNIAITWVEADMQMYEDGTLIRPLAPLLRPNVFEATKRSREAIARVDRILHARSSEPRLGEALRRKQELEAELAELNAVLDKLSTGTQVVRGATAAAGTRGQQRTFPKFGVLWFLRLVGTQDFITDTA